MYRRMNPKQLEKVIEDLKKKGKEEVGKRRPGEINMYELSRIPVPYRAEYRKRVENGESVKDLLEKIKSDTPSNLDRP